MPKTINKDLLRGARALAEFTDIPEHTIRNLAKGGATPIRKVPGYGLCANKSALRAYFGIETEKGTAQRHPPPMGCGAPWGTKW